MGFPDGGRIGCQSLVHTAGFQCTVITHARTRAHRRRIHTHTGYCSLFSHTVFTYCHTACKLTDPELSSERNKKKKKQGLLNEETPGLQERDLKT